MNRPNPTFTLRLASTSLALLLGACGMKGPLRPAAPPPPPPDASLMTPPSVSPAPTAPATATKP